VDANKRGPESVYGYWWEKREGEAEKHETENEGFSQPKSFSQAGLYKKVIGTQLRWHPHKGGGVRRGR
jgi:hypothetical protein